MTTHKTIAVLVVLAMAGSAFAKDKPKKPDAVLKDTVKELKAGLGKSDTAKVKSALTTAEKIRGDFTDKKFTPMAKAVGGGVTHKNADIARACIEALGGYKIAGTGKMLAKLLNPPAKLTEERLDLHKAAIAAAGSIHDAETAKTLEKLLGHANADIAVAAADAMGGYRGMELKQRLAIAKRLVKVLAKQEKLVAGLKDAEKKGVAEKVLAAIGSGLSKLTGKEGLTTSAEWSAWVKAEAKSA